MDQELFKFRAIIGHQGPLKATSPDWKGSKYNVHLGADYFEDPDGTLLANLGSTLIS